MRDQQDGYSADARLAKLVRTIGNGQFVFDIVCPVVEVPQLSGKIYDIEDDADIYYKTTRARGAFPGRVGENISLISYVSEEHRLEMAVPEEDTQGAVDAAIKEYRQAGKVAKRLKRRVDVAREIQLMELVTTSGSYDVNNVLDLADAEDRFDNPASDPVGVFQDAVARLKITAGCGDEEIGALMPFSVRNKMQQHVGLRSWRSQTSANGLLTKDELAKSLGIGTIISADANRRTAKVGQTTVRAAIWPKSIVIFKMTPAASGAEGGEEQRFVFNAQAPIPRSPSGGEVVETKTEDGNYSTMVRYGRSSRANFHDANVGYLITNAVS